MQVPSNQIEHLAAFHSPQNIVAARYLIHGQYFRRRLRHNPVPDQRRRMDVYLQYAAHWLGLGLGRLRLRMATKMVPRILMTAGPFGFPMHSTGLGDLVGDQCATS